MLEFRRAKKNLKNHSICIVEKQYIILSDKRGIAPIVEFIDANYNFSGDVVADQVVGKAAALLFVKEGFVAVYGKVMSEAGKKVLEDHNIRYEYGTLVPKIINRAGDDICPMEKAVMDIDDPEEAFKVLKAKVAEMKAQQNS